MSESVINPKTELTVPPPKPKRPKPKSMVMIGEQTAAEARRYGIRTRVAAQATMDALIDIIIKEGNETWN